VYSEKVQRAHAVQIGFELNVISGSARVYRYVNCMQIMQMGYRGFKIARRHYLCVLNGCEWTLHVACATESENAGERLYYANMG
jgi:hypothetical protein